MFERFVAPFEGMVLSHIWRGYGSAIFLEFGNLRPKTKRDGSAGNPDGEMSAMIDCIWRIENNMQINCGSSSDEALWEANFEDLLHQKVAEISHFEKLHEIAITFANGIRILSFTANHGQPNWALFDRRNGERVMSSISGKLVVDNHSIRSQ